jgi:hypothetical protein
MREMRNSAMMLMPATTPNSCRITLRVRAKTAKPMAAATLQNSVTTPIFETISTRAARWSDLPM